MLDLSLFADDRWLDVPCRVARCTETQVQIDGAVKPAGLKGPPHLFG